MRVIIIGAGVVGCAIAKELSEPNREVHVLEKNSKTGEGVTSRNSGVIHAGLYYPSDSLKAKLCMEGSGALYDWCEKKGVPHRKTGKLIVAPLLQEEALKNIYKNAITSGVSPSNLRWISKKEIQKINPYITGDIALHSMQSGIVDAVALCHSFYADAAQRGALFHFNCEVTEIERNTSSTLIHTSRGDLEADIVINAAGLYADDIAKLAGGDRYTIYPWRGDYFKVNLPYLIDILVYPVRKPDASGLGIHLTINLNSQTFLGPDSEPSHSKEDFSERPEKLMKFYEDASQLLSGLKPEMLTYETCGIRPKLRAFDSSEEKDFVISEDLPGFFNLIGIESPGLTASLAIARYVKQMLIY
ncbi:MAG: NAD(P)/FAD-dependent oxidoreductase [Deltaproteobacteria bacterium]